MIKFQKDHTTPEQSKRLLELGIPADSANLVYDCDLIGGEKYYSLVILDDMTFSEYKHLWESPCVDIIPCWSAFRLMEIMDICALGENSDPNIEEYPSTIKVMNKLHIQYVEYLVKSIERAVQLGTIDFSKLEE